MHRRVYFGIFGTGMSRRVSKMIHCLTGSQWRDFKVGVMWENLEAPKIMCAKQFWIF